MRMKNLVAVIMFASTIHLAVAQEAAGPSAFIVVDGDTLRSPAGVRYRLLGLDAPETARAESDEELMLGMKAKWRLQTLIASGEARIIEKGKLDKFGRTLATLTVNGKDIAETLIAEGLARPYHGQRRASWCDGNVTGTVGKP